MYFFVSFNVDEMDSNMSSGCFLPDQSIEIPTTTSFLCCVAVQHLYIRIYIFNAIPDLSLFVEVMTTGMNKYGKHVATSSYYTKWSKNVGILDTSHVVDILPFTHIPINQSGHFTFFMHEITNFTQTEINKLFNIYQWEENYLN